jgi:hypothetical protein
MTAIVAAQFGLAPPTRAAAVSEPETKMESIAAKKARNGTNVAMIIPIPGSAVRVASKYRHARLSGIGTRNFRLRKDAVAPLKSREATRISATISR